jgi:hypothetical protein
MHHPPSFDDGRPPFDSAFARKLIGKRVLIGVTRQDRRGDSVLHEQFYGTVVSADPHRGIAVALSGSRAGETKWLPPATEPFQAASKGEYRLRSTGEVVVDPDFTAQWTMTQSDA